jgi:hypothetical protein
LVSSLAVGNVSQQALASAVSAANMETMSQDRFADLRHTIARSDAFELAIALAALQLMPENADSLAVLESASEFVATVRSPRTKQFRRSDLHALLRAFETTSDPFEGVFTHSLVVPAAGAMTVFCGRDPAAPYILAALMAGIFGGPKTLEGSFVREALDSCGGLLRLSDAVATRARARRGMQAVHASPRQIVVPDDTRLAELRAAVRFTTDELRTLLGPKAVDLVLPLAHAPGGAVTDEPLEGPLHHNPLLAGQGELIVALPGCVATALTELLLRSAGARRPQLAQRFRAAVRESIEESLDELGLHEPRTADTWDASARVITTTTRFDVDAMLAIHVAVDTLDSFEPRGLDGSWDDAQSALDEMEQRALDTERALSALPPGDAPNAFLHLFVLQGVGRSHLMGLGEPAAPLRSPRLLLSAEELRTICILEAGEPLALLKFARAKEALHERVRVFAFGALAQYQLYRQTGHSFYVSDDRPTLITIDDSLAETARVDAQDRRDIHAALVPGGRGFVEVRLLEDDVRIPLYGETRPDRSIVRLVAELNVDCWVTARLTDPSALTITLAYATLATYWMWQLQPAAARLYDGASDRGQLCIELELEPGNEIEVPTDAPPGEVKSRLVGDTIVLTVPSSFANALSGSDNAGERAFVRALLLAMRSAAQTRGSRTPSDKTLEAWIGQYAPLGLKKKSLHLDVRRNFELFDEGLPQLRMLQDPDYSEVLDELGDELRRRGMPEGPIDNVQRLDVLRDAVEWAFDQLEREIATLDPRGLLEWLIAQHESVLLRQAQERLSTPTRLACYSSLPGLPGQLADDRLRLVRTAMAFRVVIEAVAARPPSGLRPMSLRLHDRLLALAEEGINRAMARDALQNALLDDKISILPSGRLGMSHEGPFYSGRTAYLGVLSDVEVEQATRYFARHWRRTSGQPDPWEDGPLDHAAVDEFGFTLTELTRLCIELAAFGLNEIEGPVKRSRRDVLVERLSAQLGWPTDRVNTGLDLFVSKARCGLRNAPTGFEPSDSYPWRMNRALSYLRRPLVERESDAGDDLIWGTRHLKQGNQYLIQLCEEGRLRAHSRSMQKAITDVRHVETRAFNHAVAERVAQCEFVVRENVKKIGKVRLLRADGGDLGDIDVLGAHRARRVIVALETKDLGLARTPLEMGQQVRSIFVGSERERCDIDKHVDRADWVRTHVGEILHLLGIDSDDISSWSVRALLVTDEALMTPYVVQTKIPVVAFRQLDERALFG